MLYGIINLLGKFHWSEVFRIRQLYSFFPCRILLFSPAREKIISFYYTSLSQRFVSSFVSSISMGLIEDLALTQAILTRYILTICLILGIIGCFCNFIVFCGKKLRSNPCSVYFIATSIFNLLVIIFGITPVLLASYLPSDPASYSSTFCKAKSYTTHAFLMMSRSSVALACVDRFALCSRNARIRSLSQRHIAIVFADYCIYLMADYTNSYDHLHRYSNAWSTMWWFRYISRHL